MPKLCLSRLSVSEPFSWPMTQTDSPRKRPKPPTMARNLGFLPGRERGIQLLQRQRRLGFDAVDFLADGDRIAASLQRAQLLDLGLEFGHRLFEIEIGTHRYGQPAP